MSEEPWAAVERENWPHRYRWSDARWDWFLGSVTALDDAQLATVRDRLAGAN